MKRRDQQPQSDVEKGREDADGEATRFRRRPAHGFDSKSGKDERVAEADQRATGEAERGPRRSPDEREAGGFDHRKQGGGSGAADPVRHLTVTFRTAK